MPRSRWRFERRGRKYSRHDSQALVHPSPPPLTKFPLLRIIGRAGRTMPSSPSSEGLGLYPSPICVNPPGVSSHADCHTVMQDPRGGEEPWPPVEAGPSFTPTSPPTRAHSAGMPELESAGRGEGGGL